MRVRGICYYLLLVLQATEHNRTEYRVQPPNVHLFVLFRYIFSCLGLRVTMLYDNWVQLYSKISTVFQKCAFLSVVTRIQ